MKVPYNELELKTFLINLDTSVLEKTEVQDLIKQNFPETHAELNVSAAAFHGISVFDLINSPNYNLLLEAYRESRVLNLVRLLQEQGYSHQESWAIICILFEVIT